MYARVIWPEKYDPKTSAIYALNDIDVKAPLKWSGGCWSTPRAGRANFFRQTYLVI